MKTNWEEATGSICLSVDWDFFVPLPCDVGAPAESSIFVHHIWNMGARSSLRGKITTSGDEKHFWSTLDEYVSWMKDDLRFDPPDLKLYVSESHVHSFEMLESDTIILFDQHHDCWPLDGDGQVRCHNWASAWLVVHPCRRLVWVRPDWLPDVMTLDEHCDVAAQVEVVKYSELATSEPFITMKSMGGPVSTIHICRSGAWTPPWLDHSFISFVEAAERMTGRPPELLPPQERLKRVKNAELLNPMIPRRFARSQRRA